MKHLAIFNDVNVIEKILRGEKIIESRFSRHKDLPYGKIKKGDEIYMKESGGKIKGRVLVDNVLFYGDLSPEKIGTLRKEYSNEILADDDFWESYAKSKYVSLIFLKNPERFVSAIKFKKHDRRGWMIIR